MATSETDTDTDLLYELTPSGVAWITLNRPDAGNAVTPQQRNDMAQLLTAASGDLNVRCIVITAAGDRHFCTGADLRVSKLVVDNGNPPDAPERPTVALSYAKWCVNRAMDVDRRISFGDEAIAQEAVMTSVDANEGVAAFVERRQPVYRGW